MVEAATVWFLIMAAVCFLVAGVLAPLETLAWWVGRFSPQAQFIAQPQDGGSDVRHFVIYLGGINAIDGETLSHREMRFLKALEAGLPDARLVCSVFPYAASGEPLLQAPRFFRWVWRLAAKRPKRHRTRLKYLIDWRNFYQVLVSADRRYGPVFNEAVASLMLSALIEEGWRRGASQRVSILGYSAGAQIAIAAAPYLARALDASPAVVSIGGVILTTRGVDGLARVDHLVSGADLLPRLGSLLSVAQWPIAALSSWRKALRLGRLRKIDLGVMRHSGKDGYLGEAASARPDMENWRVTLLATLTCLATPIAKPPLAVVGRLSPHPNSSNPAS